MPSDVEVPEEAVEAAARAFVGELNPELDHIEYENEAQQLQARGMPQAVTAAAPAIRKQERQRLSQELAHVRGHLEGYADALALTGTVNKGMLVRSLREDAAALESLEDDDG